MTITDEQRGDYADLLERPQFRRFLLSLIQMSGIYDATANGSAERHFFNEGRRSLGLDILRMVDAAQPAPGQSFPSLTLIQVHREDAQSTPQQRTSNGRRNGIYSDLGADGGNDGGD